MTGEEAPTPASTAPPPRAGERARDAARARVFLFGALALALGLVTVLALEGDEGLDGLDDYLVLALALAAAVTALRSLRGPGGAEVRRANDRVAMLLAAAAVVKALWVGIEIRDAVDVGDDAFALVLVVVLLGNRFWP